MACIDPTHYKVNLTIDMSVDMHNPFQMSKVSKIDLNNLEFGENTYTLPPLHISSGGQKNQGYVVFICNFGGGEIANFLFFTNSLEDAIEFFTKYFKFYMKYEIAEGKYLESISQVETDLYDAWVVSNNPKKGEIVIGLDGFYYGMMPVEIRD